MPPVLASARVGEHLARRRGKAERVVEFPIGEQSCVGGDHRTAKLDIRRRSKSSRRTSPLDSPAGFSMAASINNMQYFFRQSATLLHHHSVRI
jgi:hypothetical protein